MLDHEPWASVVPLHFIGLTDPATGEQLERHLRGCAACRDEWDRLSGLDGHAAWNAVEAVPAGHATMRRSFLRQLRQDGGRSRISAPARTWWSIGVAASLAVAIWGWGAYMQAAGLVAQDDALLATLSAGRRLSLHGAAYAASRVDLYLAADRAVVWVKRLPRLSPDQTYEGWWIVGGRAVPAGEFGTRPAVLAVPAHASRFAVTVEPRGGTAAPTTPILAATPI